FTYSRLPLEIDRIRELETRLSRSGQRRRLRPAPILAPQTGRRGIARRLAGSAASLEHVRASGMSEWLAPPCASFSSSRQCRHPQQKTATVANVEGLRSPTQRARYRLERHKSPAMFAAASCLPRPPTCREPPARHRHRPLDFVAVAPGLRRGAPSHPPLQSRSPAARQLSDRLAEIFARRGRGAAAALENRARLSDTAAQAGAKATGRRVAEARWPKRPKLVRKWAGYAPCAGSQQFDHGAAAGESVAAPAAGSPEMAKVARLDSVDAVASVPRVEDADADYYDDEPPPQAATAAAAAAAAAKYDFRRI
uniref:Uncharacterized protein n=1 Tax=Macrostomum lignano TaxID=282301 RepID=A0A1I8IHS0_9PLAT